MGKEIAGPVVESEMATWAETQAFAWVATNFPDLPLRCKDLRQVTETGTWPVGHFGPG